jgi:hypothetical protein
MTQEAQRNERQKKRLRKRWIVLAVVGVLIALVAIRITRFVIAKPTIATNYAIAYNDLTRPARYDPNDNAALLYEKAFEILSEARGDREALDMVARAAEQPYWWVKSAGLDWTEAGAQTEIGAQMVGFRQAAQDLRDQAIWLAGNGDIDQALQSVTTIGRMARHAGRPGIMLRHGLVGPALNGLAQVTAFELLAECTIGADLLEAFQQNMEATLVAQAPLSFAGERIRLLNVVQHCFSDDGKGDGHLIVGTVFDAYRQMEELPNELADAAAYLNHLVIAWRHPSRKETAELLEDLFTRLDELARQTPWQLHQTSMNYEEEIRKRIAGYYFLELGQLDRSLSRPIEIHHRARVSGEALVATIAVLRYRQDNGQWPESLEELVGDGYMPRVPVDPFSGNALVYRPTGETFLLYSLGADFDDDGGTPSKWGTGTKGGDQVFWPR